MKQAVMALAIGVSLALGGCADLQKQAVGFTSSSQAGNQQVAYEGGQPVQSLGDSQSASGRTGAQRDSSDGGSSFVTDMAKDAASSLKNEVSSSIRSAIRGAFR